MITPICTPHRSYRCVVMFVLFFAVRCWQVPKNLMRNNQRFSRHSTAESAGTKKKLVEVSVTQRCEKLGIGSPRKHGENVSHQQLKPSQRRGMGSRNAGCRCGRRAGMQECEEESPT
ncbi:hypothetical protein QBC41DRAFT_322213 [Cercophora samala]|uniref:Secreted protein n=1 Tax=Cercophora samala TaxID=330535 RepID=A0AA40D9L7_9PEZI|nr:hypothetical protein QBC41DRAFT_322213 [Cercophora samala]